MQELELTPGRFFRIYWTILWRTFVGAVLIGALVGFAIGLAAGMMGYTAAQITPVTGTAGALVGIVWAIAVFWMALKKRYREFRIAIVALEPLVPPSAYNYPPR